MHKRRVVSAASLAVIGFTLSACNGDDGESAAKESPAASASASASAPASSEPSSESPTDDSGNGGEAPADGDVTAPGTKLKTGDRAVLPFRYTSDKQGTIAVTVTAIEKGAESDMAAFGDKAKGMTPYFIKMKVENVGGTDLSYASLKLDGVLDGGAGTGVILMGDIPGKCDRETAPRDFTTKGATYETCSLAATKTAPVTGAEYDEGDTYSDNPVVWTN
ncbi:hypothetical protein OH733_19340 [Streptomyces griseus]|uniref:hypothetical protein n=1 Tax=Streptomyces griseus TaxID=1911 RepID=UPI0038663821|nr:hypothetical protein OG554_19100 [Streptomyces fimicarius]WTC88770.1 hypothetical protein OH733_19340 [Streptomyces griseus]WTD68606.1 hypothetical protein OH763_17650 [Streptomyces griseus]